MKKCLIIQFTIRNLEGEPIARVRVQGGKNSNDQSFALGNAS